MTFVPASLIPVVGPPADNDPNGSPIIPSPAISAQLLCIGSPDGIFHALDITTGQERWACRPGHRPNREAVVGQVSMLLRQAPAWREKKKTHLHGTSPCH